MVQVCPLHCIGMGFMKKIGLSIVGSRRRQVAPAPDGANRSQDEPSSHSPGSGPRPHARNEKVSTSGEICPLGTKREQRQQIAPSPMPDVGSDWGVQSSQSATMTLSTSHSRNGNASDLAEIRPAGTAEEQVHHKGARKYSGRYPEDPHSGAACTQQALSSTTQAKHNGRARDQKQWSLTAVLQPNEADPIPELIVATCSEEMRTKIEEAANTLPVRLRQVEEFLDKGSLLGPITRYKRAILFQFPLAEAHTKLRKVIDEIKVRSLKQFLHIKTQI